MRAATAAAGIVAGGERAVRVEVGGVLRLRMRERIRVPEGCGGRG